MSGAGAYLFLILLLRASGKRTLSKMNAFDLVVTVALGSTFATVLLDRSVPLAEGILALALLVFLQFVIAWASVRSENVRSLVKSRPTSLVKNGKYRTCAMQKQHVARDEVEAALRIIYTFQKLRSLYWKRTAPSRSSRAEPSYS